MENKKFIKNYNVAGVGFSVETPVAYNHCYPYELFLSEKESKENRYQFVEVEELPTSDGVILYENSYLRFIQKSDGIYRFIYCAIKKNPYACTCFKNDELVTTIFRNKQAPPIWDGLVFEMLGLEHLLNKHNRMILHAAYTAVKGEAILFTAPSGTGKTTQANLWKKFRNAEIINGDRVCLSVEDGNVFAHGIPMAGTSKICKNCSMKVRAIVVLEQAKENSVEYLKGRKAFRKLYSETWINAWDIEDVHRMIQLISLIMESVPIILLKCLPEYSAVELLEKHIFCKESEED